MQENSEKKQNFKFFTYASNKNGTKIFCRLALNKKSIIKGYYDFNKDKFFITSYVKSNFTNGVCKNLALQKLKELMLIEYDWEI